MTVAGQPPREPLRSTLVRNALLTLVAATVLVATTARGAHPIHWPLAVVLMLWPSFGGHFVEEWYLQWLAPRLPPTASVRRLARIGTWFVGGCGLGLGVVLTARAFGGAPAVRWPAWWIPGVLFVGLELVVHLALTVRGQPSVFNDRR